jgi:hypothetical protein
MGEVDRSHAALPQLALEEIAVTQGFPKLTGGVGHGGGLKWRPFESVLTRFDLLAN